MCHEVEAVGMEALPKGSRNWSFTLPGAIQPVKAPPASLIPPSYVAPAPAPDGFHSDAIIEEVASSEISMSAEETAE
jgi:hypothetical protein